MAEIPKVLIELTPYQALNIAIMLEHCKCIDFDHADSEYLRDAKKTYMEQVTKKITPTQLDDALAERNLNQLIGKEFTGENNES